MAARTLDQIVRDTLGNHALSVAQLTAELEALQEKHAVLEAEHAALKTAPHPPVA